MAIRANIAVPLYLPPCFWEAISPTYKANHHGLLLPFEMTENVVHADHQPTLSEWTPGKTEFELASSFHSSLSVSSAYMRNIQYYIIWYISLYVVQISVRDCQKNSSPFLSTLKLLPYHRLYFPRCPYHLAKSPPLPAVLATISEFDATHAQVWLDWK